MEHRTRRSRPARRNANNLAAGLASAHLRRTTHMDRQYTKFQQKAIKNFYDNRESISIQRLGELVTDLYLAEGKSRGDQVEANRHRAGTPRRAEDRDRAPGEEGRPGAAGEEGDGADGKVIAN